MAAAIPAIRTMVPPDINLLGTELNATASLVTTTTDGNQANNTATNLRTITGAYDPNDKLAYTSSGSTEVWDVNADEWIDYTIRFQNTGTDTAFTVLITDSLPETLDPGSIIVGAASHNFTWELRDQGTLKFFFQNILLPDSNVNEPRSHGFASFRIKPHEPVLPGSTIENTANIYFDFNPPVITEPSVLVAEFSTGIPDAKASSTYVAYPVPAAGRIFLSNVTSGNSTNGWSILQVDGRVIRSSNSAFPSNGVDVSDLADGTYLLQVNSVPMPVTIRFAKSH
ncbi:MAG: T9SS type A sorting domain-containing protein [Flavobacteriales bacterium]|nr:T9SS type A sorting domain-containing protein [Flavobacteriales bacterium]